MLDHNNGKTVVGVTHDSITFDDGTTIRELLSIPIDEIVGTKLLKVTPDEDVAYLIFGHPRPDGNDPTVVATVEAVGDDLRAENA